MVLIATLACTTLLCSQDQPASAEQNRFPDTETLMKQVARHQHELEALVDQYTWTDKMTHLILDKNGKVKSQHTDVYYVTPTAYEIFALHISHDGQALPQSDLEEQEKDIEKRLKEDERKSEQHKAIHPKDQISFGEVFSKSRFKPLRWEDRDGYRTIVYAYEPKSISTPKGSLEQKIAGDVKGQVWISPDEEQILRIEFTSVSSIGLGMGLLGKVKNFEGFAEQKKIGNEVWLPSRQEYVAQGRQLVSGFRIREVSEFSQYLKATTDVFQQVHSQKASSGQTN
jgi:hypothetical protein